MLSPIITPGEGVHFVLASAVRGKIYRMGIMLEKGIKLSAEAEEYIKNKQQPWGNRVLQYISVKLDEFLSLNEQPSFSRTIEHPDDLLILEGGPGVDFFVFNEFKVYGLIRG